MVTSHFNTNSLFDCCLKIRIGSENKKIEIRSVIQFFYLEGKTAKEFEERIAPTLGQSYFNYDTVRLWINKFKWGRTIIEDAQRPWSPKSAVTPENIDKVHDVVLADRRVEVRQLAEAAAISIERVDFIFYEELHMAKLFARWVSRLLILEQKRNRMQKSIECLYLFKKNSADFFAAFCNNEQNLDPPLYAGNETGVKTVNWTTIRGLEKGKKRSICWKDDGVSFLRRERNLSH